jgi:hypothetical protein
MTRTNTVRAGNTIDNRAREGTRLSGGQALKQAIHVARARTDLTSDMGLARRAGVSYDTFMNWFGDKTVPRPHEVKKVADVLGRSLRGSHGSVGGSRRRAAAAAGCDQGAGR